MTLIAMLTFASTEFPGLAHSTGSIAATAPQQPLILEQNLHISPTDRLVRSFEAFAPVLALLFLTLVVLDTISHRAGDRRQPRDHRRRDHLAVGGFGVNRRSMEAMAAAPKRLSDPAALASRT
ncbi:hypothetical protein [Candidatus Binatus sp.]|uniref:hypothetical protein n=1 Tax=Candidatus Binatus sp. TaxID=2811406 RepID=UPI002729678B|nr:hypothetical protein [Candidatus Binatus sp.]